MSFGILCRKEAAFQLYHDFFVILYYIVLQMKTITIRLSDELESKLSALIDASGNTKSEVIREALEKHLSVKSFQQLRNRVLPFAEAQGLLTDEDIFQTIS
ncbi:CopG family transcriptional regulator (modular protein) [Marinoscillum sp. 108]|nr:CopG family transcriptional regulator (modular protein) [Marinoscillum sp. 108]